MKRFGTIFIHLTDSKALDKCKVVSRLFLVTSRRKEILCGIRWLRLLCIILKYIETVRNRYQRTCRKCPHLQSNSTPIGSEQIMYACFGESKWKIALLAFMVDTYTHAKPTNCPITLNAIHKKTTFVFFLFCIRFV